MKKEIKNKDIELIDNEIISDDNSDDEIELKKPEKPEKPKKIRKEFIFTDAKKQQMKNAHEVKMKNFEIRKQGRDEKNKEYIKEKEELTKLKDEKQQKKQQRELIKLKKSVAEISESEEEEIIVKKKTKPKKKIIYIESSSDDEIEYRKQIKPPKQQLPPSEPIQQPPRQLRRIIQYV